MEHVSVCYLVLIFIQFVLKTSKTVIGRFLERSSQFSYSNTQIYTAILYRLENIPAIKPVLHVLVTTDA